MIKNKYINKRNEGEESMAKGPNQKMKLVYMIKILLENTDDEHSLTGQEITDLLEKYEISVERKSIYRDIAEIQDFGLDVIKYKQGRKNYYRIGNREFELPELKLLVDAVQSSKFITEKKSNELIKKLEKLTSRHEAQKLQRQVYISGRIKTVNEKIYYSVDKIHTAISNNVKIKFQYYQWTVDKKQELRRNGDFYYISPWSLVWEDENYYMVGYDDVEEIVKHFRVDKMLNLDITDDKRQGKELMDKFDVATYSKKVFGMFNGEEKNVVIEFTNNFAGVVIDRFGKDVAMVKIDDEHFKVCVRVAVSRQFLGWIISLGEGVEIISPDTVVDKMREEVERLCRTYGGNKKVFIKKT